MKNLKSLLTLLLLTFIVYGFTSDDTLSKQKRMIVTPKKMIQNHVQYVQRGMTLNPIRLSLGKGLTLNMATGKVSVNPNVNLNIPLVSYYQDADAKAYREAYKNILNEKWDKAVDSLKEFKEDYPKSRRLSSAEYWICFSHEKLDYSDEKVFELYEEFIEKYPNSSWVDDARSNMIRIGSELIRSGNKEYEVKVQDLNRDSDEALSLAALYALGTDNEEVILPQVIEMYDNTANERIRKELVYILVRFESEPAVDKMFQIIKEDPDSQIRAAAINFLSDSAPERAIELINDLIWNDPDTEVRKAAVYTLARIEKRESANLLIKIVSEHTDSEIREAAIHMLSERQVNDSDVIKILEDVIFNSNDLDLKKTALYSLIRSDGKAKDDLIIRLLKSSEEPEVRTAAIHSLSERSLRDGDLLKILEDIVFNSDNTDLQKTAAYSLMQADNSQKTEILINILKKHDDPELRKIAIEGLPEKSLKSKELMKIMEDILFNDSDSGLQKTAIYSLSRGGNPETITLLANVISNHKDPDIRKTALYSIPEARTYQIAFPVLSDIIFKGNDEELQKAALYTIMRLNNKESKQLIANVITDHKNPALKIAALHAITAKNINDELVLNLENIIVKSSNEELRRAALLSIMRYDKDRYIQLLIRMIEEKKDDELILYAAQFLPGALSALPGKATKTTVDFLEDLIFDKSRFSDRKSSLREQTIYMLEGMKGDKSLDLLIKIAKTHEDTKIRKAAVMALGRSKNPKAKKALLEIIKKR